MSPDSPFTVPAPPPVNAPAVTPEDVYTFVEMPDGSVRAVRKSEIQKVSEIETATQNITATPEVPKVEAQFYVWLADGSVVRVKESDLPVPAGTNAVNGHWQRDKNVYLIVGVYPVEDIVKGDNNG